MERIKYESVWLFRPELADEFVRREAFERLQPAREIVCGDEVREMRAQLGVRFTVASLIVRFMRST